jgi:hypothetical protein
MPYKLPGVRDTLGMRYKWNIVKKVSQGMFWMGSVITPHNANIDYIDDKKRSIESINVGQAKIPTSSHCYKQQLPSGAWAEN